MKNFFLSFTVLTIGIILISGNVTMSQSVGDYQSRQSGNWNDINTWEQFDGTDWVTEYPSDGFPVIAGTSTSAKTTTTTAVHTIDLPADIQFGDLILIFWADANNSSTAPTLPAGYTLLASSNSGTTSIYRRIWYRVADGTEGASVSTTNSFGDRSAHVVYRIAAGSYTGTPFISAADNGTDNSPNPPNLAPGIGTQKFLWLATTLTAEVQTYSIPANFSNDISIGTTSSSTSSAHSQVITAQRFLEAASLDVGAFSLNGSAVHTAYSLAIQGQVLYTPISSPAGRPDFPVVAGTETSFQSSNVGSHLVNLPSGIQAGDLLLIFWADRDNSSTLSTPEGWTELYNSASGNFRAAAFYRIADGNEGATVTMTTSSTERSAQISYRIQAGTYSGVPEASNVATGSTNSPNPPSLTPTWGNANNLWIAATHSAGNTTVTSAPADFTDLLFIASGGTSTNNSTALMGTAIREFESSSLDPGAFTLAAPRTWLSRVIAIQGPIKSNVSILDGHTVTVTANQTSDNVTVETGGTLVVNDGVSLDVSVELLVLSSETLTMNGEALITGAGDFTLGSGATIEIGSVDGITLTDAAGNIQVTGTRTYSSDANYVYNGTEEQVTGDGLPASVNNLTIDNEAGATLTNDVDVDGTLTFVNGLLTTGAKTVDLGTSGTITGEANGSYLVGNLTVTRDVPAVSDDPVDFGGIGVEIEFEGTTPTDLGSVNITRISGPGSEVTGDYGHESISRTWTIVPENQPTFESSYPNIKFDWVSDDNNGVNEHARYIVIYSEDGNSPWQETGAYNHTDESITIRLNQFSTFSVISKEDVWYQYGFGDDADIFTGPGGSTDFLPSPGTNSGSTFVSIGSAGEGYWELEDLENIELSEPWGTGISLTGAAATGSNPVNKFSITGFSGTPFFTLRFDMVLEGGAGDWYFFAGDEGSSYTGTSFPSNSNNDFFVALWWELGTGNEITTYYKNNSGNWIEIDEAFFVKGGTYTIDIFANNSQESRYYANFIQTDIEVYARHWHLWVNGENLTPLGGFDKAFNISRNSINSFAFVGNNSPDNDAIIHLDNFNYSNFFDEENEPLPVELTSFTAKVVGPSVKLNWRTETEAMNYGFDVERKAINENEWKKVGFVEGNGNSNSPKDYSFSDKNIKPGSYSYRLKQIDTDGQYEYSKVVEVDFNMPKEFALSQNYPNPFNPTTKITFSIPVTSNVSLQIYNILGQKVVDAIMDQVFEAGVYEYNFDGTQLSSGIYLYTIQADKFSQTKKMLMIK